MNYQEFLSAKVKRPALRGFDVSTDDLNPRMFPFQKDIVKWALQLGTSAIFAECGLGKTLMQLEWAHQVVKRTGESVLVLAPLAVNKQTVIEGVKFGIEVTPIESMQDVTGAGVYIVNYDRLHLIDPAYFVGVVLDESSIIKNDTGKTRNALIESFSNTPYRLACTATPSPNDHVELGNHAEFLGIMQHRQMLATWFLHDSANTQDWRLKGHAEADFWRWVTSWAVCVSTPADLGYNADNFQLPPLELHEHFISAPSASYDRAKKQGMLFAEDNPSATRLHVVKKESIGERAQKARELVDSLPADEPIILWCDTDYEADALLAVLPQASELRGSHSRTKKEDTLNAFTDGKIRLLITKPEIAGFGLNWQHCSNMIFVGVSYSFERLYQALRRSWRYGQTRPVNAHLIYAETEGNIMVRLNDKQIAFKEMQAQMNHAVRTYGLFRNGDAVMDNLKSADTESKNYRLLLGDCVQRVKEVADESIDFSIFSPPFANLYVYSQHHADMGNSENDEEFIYHFSFLLQELHRIMKSGRIVAIHCADLPMFKWKDGTTGLKDFSGDIIRAMMNIGFTYQSRITIWKDPVTEMQRTKAHGLLHKNFSTHAEKTRVGNPDYLLIFSKKGDAETPVTHTDIQIGEYVGTNPPSVSDYTGHGKPEKVSWSIATWQRYASPVWMDIDQTRTLNERNARSEQDERHICPLQLDVIARGIHWFTNKGETVFSPFAGIGSEGYEAIRMGRKFIGIELKEEYFNEAVKNLNEAERQTRQKTLFDLD